MEQKQRNFEDLLKFGEDGEHEVASVLLKRGVSLLPLYQFKKEHAPFILTDVAQVTSPDLICFKMGCFMVEVKTKNRWSNFGGILETGLSLKLYKQYKAVADSTGLQVWVFFNHKTTAPIGLFYTKLESFTREWDGFYKGVQKYEPMVFWSYECLHQLHDNDRRPQ